MADPEQDPPPPPQQSHDDQPSPRKLKKTSSSSGKHPLYRGIRSRSGKWVSEIREPKKTSRIWLGTYPSPEMAAAAYDVAALALKGKDTVLNFPQQIQYYPIPDSTSPHDIRRAAAGAAALNKDTGTSQALQTNHLNDAAGLSTNYDHNVDHQASAGSEYIDEEELFDMPNLIRGMAEGMLVSPPRILGSRPSDHDSSDGEERLWSY